MSICSCKLIVPDDTVTHASMAPNLNSALAMASTDKNDKNILTPLGLVAEKKKHPGSLGPRVLLRSCEFRKSERCERLLLQCDQS